MVGVRSYRIKPGRRESIRLRTFLLIFSLALVLHHPHGFAQKKSDSSATRDGQHDFDFEIGTWKTQLRRLVQPLSGSNDWAEYEGTTVVRKVLNGRANLAELVVEGPSGRIEGLSLRLYNPQSRQWSIHYASIRSGTLTQPVTGSFKNGRGEFYSQEMYNGRAIFVRFVISDITPNSCRFEQAFSEDGGKTWEPNWIAIDTRVKDGSEGGGNDSRSSKL